MYHHVNNVDLNDFLVYLNKSRNINKNSGLYKCLKNGIGFIHEYTDNNTKIDICKFYKSKAIRILIVVHSLCYDLEIFRLKNNNNITSSVIIYGTKFYCGLSHNFIDYELCDIQQMLSFINSEKFQNKAYILCHSNRKSFLSKFIIIYVVLQIMIYHNIYQN